MDLLWNEVLRVLGFMGNVLLKVWPYLLVSIPLAVAVRLSPAGTLLKKHLGSRPLLGILLGTLLGALSPLCSCTVIPVVWSLLTAGVPLGAVMSFWIASPSMDPEIFFLSVATLGWPLAIWRLSATFLLALGGGLATHLLVKNGFFREGILRKDPVLKIQSFSSLGRKIWTTLTSGSGKVRLPEDRAVPASLLPPLSPAPHNQAGFSLFTAVPGGSPGAPRTASSGCCTPATNQASCCEPKAGSGSPKPAAQGSRQKLLRRVGRESLDALIFVGKFMLLAYFLEALIVLYLPAEWVTAVLGGEGFLSVVTATLAGIPLYMTNITALGMLGGLMAKGMTGGAALAFLIAGPTTTLPAMSAVFGLTKPRVFLVYLGISLAGALILGSAYLVFG